MIDTDFVSAAEFSEGLARVWDGVRYGYIDRTGKAVIPPQYVLAESFSDGAARVILQGPCNHQGPGPCALANAGVAGAPGSRETGSGPYPLCRYSFIDRRGNPLGTATYSDAFDFSEGFAAIKDDSGRWGFIGRQGTLEIMPHFEQAGSFSQGLAPFQAKGKWGYIGRDGQVAIPAQYGSVSEFTEGMAVAGDSRGRYWFIDRSGKKLFGREFDDASGFHLGLAHVKDGRTMAYINRKGLRVFEYPYSPLPPLQ